MSVKCMFSATGKHEWKDIVITTGPTDDPRHNWPHVQCVHCGNTSWKRWDGQIVLELEGRDGK